MTENEKTYIGDGVYAHHDGWHIWLTTQEGMRIALEPDVLHSLNKYYKMLNDKYATVLDRIDVTED